MGFCVSGEMSLCIHVCLYFLMCVFVCVRQTGERASLERQWDAVLKERKKGRQKERMHHHWICVKIATQQMQWLECNLSGYITMCLRVCACKYMCMHLHLFLCLSQIFSPIWSLCRTSCPLCISCSACRYSFFLLLKLPNCFTDWFGFFHKKETILQFYPEPETFLPWFVDSLAHFNGVICKYVCFAKHKCTETKLTEEQETCQLLKKRWEYDQMAEQEHCIITLCATSICATFVLFLNLTG